MAARTRQRFFYVCSNGHEMGAPSRQTACRACVQGKPCGRTLKAVK